MYWWNWVRAPPNIGGKHMKLCHRTCHKFWIIWHPQPRNLDFFPQSPTSKFQQTGTLLKDFSHTTTPEFQIWWNPHPRSPNFSGYPPIISTCTATSAPPRFWNGIGLILIQWDNTWLQILWNLDENLPVFVLGYRRWYLRLSNRPLFGLILWDYWVNEVMRVMQNS